MPPEAPRDLSGQSFLRRPSTRAGRVAVALLGLAIGFLLLLAIGVVLSPDHDPEDFVDYVVFAFLILTLVGAAASAIAAGVASGYALTRRHERSWLVMIALLSGVVSLLLTAVELLGHEEPGRPPRSGANTESRDVIVLYGSGGSPTAVGLSRT